MIGEKISFEAADLSKLERGKVFISAPSLNDVMQINAGRQDGKIPLDITIDEGSVLVKRVGGGPLQVAILGNFYNNHEDMTHKVFYRPQPEVHFTQVDETDWQIENGTDVIDGSFRIGVFADVLSLYALQHQRRQRRKLTQSFHTMLLEHRASIEARGSAE